MKYKEKYRLIIALIFTLIFFSINFNIKSVGSENDKDQIDLIKRLCINDQCMSLIGFNLRKLVFVFKKAKLAIANDGGVREIASISGTNLIALAGPVDLELDAPFKYASIIHHKLPCYPCKWSEPCKKSYGVWCMDLITVQEVIGAIEEIMNNKIKNKFLKDILP